MLKKTFTDITTDQLNICDDQLFSRNDSTEIFFTSDFNYLFDIGDIHLSSKPLPAYSTSNIETLDNYFKEWIIQYDQLKLTKWKVDEMMLKMIYDLRKPFLTLLVALTINYEQNNRTSPTSKTLCGLVTEKMMTILCISERQKRRYWSGMWRLIELFHVTQCPVNILVKARITSKFLMTASINNYDKFLKTLLNDNEVFHKIPLFDELLMQKVKEIVYT